MGQQINVNIRMDSEVKENADALFNELGFNLTTAINAFVKQSLRERAIPFQIRADANANAYFSGTNMKYINQSLEDSKNGNFVIKTMKELEDMANEWIDDSNRLIYKILDNDSIEVLHCQGHYSDK